jgi:hypothetical protein
MWGGNERIKSKGESRAKDTCQSKIDTCHSQVKMNEKTLQQVSDTPKANAIHLQGR